jgi:hypothetical protein
MRNAHAFQHEGFSFVVVTLPMVELIFHVSQRLSRAPRLLQPLRIDPEAADLDKLHGLLFEIQLSYLVSHEYAHHVHRHIVEGTDGAARVVWSSLNFPPVPSLTFSCWRCWPTFALSGRRAMTWPLCINLRILLRQSEKYLIQVAEMWCGQNGSVPKSWFVPARLQELFSTAAEVIGEKARLTWDADIAILRSGDGLAYEQQLFEKFEVVRKGGGETQTAPSPEGMN